MKPPNQAPERTVKSVPLVPFTAEPKLIRLPEVMAITGLCKTTIYKLKREGKFPQTVPMGVVKCAFWSNLEVYKWVESPTEYKQNKNKLKEKN